MILAIDTATEFAGLALVDNNAVWAEEVWHAARNHTVELMPRLNRILAETEFPVANLAGIAVSLGPGSYTGVRIAVAIAKGLSLPHGIPVIGVPTLDVTAYPHRGQSLTVTAIAQAGRKRILMAQYGWVDQQWRQTQLPTLTTVAELAQNLANPTLITGELNAEAIAQLQAANNDITVASPAMRVRRPAIIAELGQMKRNDGTQGAVSDLVPIYLKDP